MTLSLSTAWVEEMWLPVSWQQLSDSTDRFLQDAVTTSMVVMWLLPHSKFLYAGHLPGYQINGVGAIGRRGINSREGGWRTKEGKRWIGKPLWCAWLQMHLPSGFASLGAKMLFILSSKLCCKIYAQYVLEYRSQPVPEELHQQLNSWLQILANCLDRGF